MINDQKTTATVCSSCNHYVSELDACLVQHQLFVNAITQVHQCRLFQTLKKQRSSTCVNCGNKEVREFSSNDVGLNKHYRKFACYRCGNRWEEEVTDC